MTKDQISSGISRSRVADLPVVDHPAELLGGAIEEGLLLGRQNDRRDGAQTVPVRAPGEQLGIEADRAGLQRLLLGLGDLRQGAADRAERRLDDKAAAHLRDGQDSKRDGGQPPDQAPEPERSRHPIDKPGLPNECERRHRPGPDG